MTLLRDAFHAITEKRFTERLPMGRTPSLSGVLNLTQSAAPTGQTAQLNSYGSASWLNAVVDMISESASSIPWTFHRQANDGGLTPLPREHPLARLWRRPNPFMTGRELREIGQQHMCLVGERWRLIVRGAMGQVLELWPIRPDRIRPIESTDRYIDHYVYQIGTLRYRLELEDIIYDHLPSPMDAYRGTGPIPALLLDVGNERAAAAWTSAFFNNAAEPGGILEYPEHLEDDEFEQIRDRWQLQHRGVQNAHRVAIIEGGKWVERKYTQRDMQFEQLRKLNRDTILGAYRMPAAMMGVSETVNRANALAAETHFGRWVVRPRLERERETVNEHLCTLYGPDIVAMFTDPTPEDRELNLEESTKGYTSGILTLNEARQRLGEDEMDGGDEVKPDPAPLSLMASLGTQRTKSDVWQRQPADPLNQLDSLAQQEEVILERWAERLSAEADALVEHVEQFKDVANSPGMHMVKIELSDVDQYNWDWWSRYGDDVVDEIALLLETSVMAQLPGLEPALAQRLAREYAELRGAELLTVSGSINLVERTKARVRILVAQTIERGDSLQTLQRSLRSDFAFSRSRAAVVARTETATAHGNGGKQAGLIDGADQKRWITQGDDVVDPDCVANEGAGWIPISDPFPSGVDHIPDHPNCRCNTIYRLAPVPEPEQRIITMARCPDCGRVLDRDIPAGAKRFCRSKGCKQVVAIVGAT